MAVTLEALADMFRRQYDASPEISSVAPGRVNLIGEHTDYNGGFVFPAAIDRQVYLAAAAVPKETSLYSELTGRGEPFDAGTTMPGEVSGWSAYAAGMAWVLRDHTGRRMPNIQGVVASTLPMGSGVSSSAAIELAFGILWNEVAGLGIDNKTLALLAQRCENLYVGVNCGIMDQMASAMGRAGAAMFLDTRSLDIEYAGIPDDLAIVICDTKKPRALTASAYNERRSQCEAAAQVLGVPQLRDANSTAVEESRSRMPETVYRRARHVVTENERCLAFRPAVESGDREQIRELMRASHMSLKEDYEVSCRELDAMAESCWNAPGCAGARMTGAGFGGGCVALVERSSLADFTTAVAAEYESRIGISGELTTCRPVQGAHILGV